MSERVETAYTDAKSPALAHRGRELRRATTSEMGMGKTQRTVQGAVLTQ